jgi:3-deoxy-7-phosphoheptulonate synthase
VEQLVYVIEMEENNNFYNIRNGGNLLIVVMESGCSEEEIEQIKTYIESKPGFTAHLSPGTERTIIGVIGPSSPDFRNKLEQMPGVNEVVPISKPYKLAGRDMHPEDTIIQVGDVLFGGNEMVVIAGPCSIESENQLMSTAVSVKKSGARVLRGGAFKPRSSPYAFRGLGVEGLKLLYKAGKETGLPVCTEVMTSEDVDVVAEYADIVQIGARNIQNFMLLDTVGKIKKPVLLKRGFATTYEEWLLSAEYIMAGGNPNVILCERGVRTFETYTRNILDVAAVPSIKRLSHLPIIVDPSHGTGRWHLVPPMALSSVAAGTHGLIIEVHPNPDRALSDGPQSLTLENFDKMMHSVRIVASAVGAHVAEATS